jgi:hypothetical protein
MSKQEFYLLHLKYLNNHRPPKIIQIKKTFYKNKFNNNNNKQILKNLNNKYINNNNNNNN